MVVALPTHLCEFPSHKERGFLGYKTYPDLRDKQGQGYGVF